MLRKLLGKYALEKEAAAGEKDEWAMKDPKTQIAKLRVDGRRYKEDTESFFFIC